MVGGVVLERPPVGYVAPQELTRPQFIYARVHFITLPPYLVFNGLFLVTP
jgi:hypothetical protein